MTPAFLTAFDTLPIGTFRVIYKDRPHIVTKSALSMGKAQKLATEELGGTDYLPLHLYRLASGPLLKPCEMPAEKEVTFTLGLKPI